MKTKIKNIALVAHDNRKEDMKQWVAYNYKTLFPHHIICTGTTGILVQKTINNKIIEDKFSKKTKSITILKSGPLGGDQQLGSLIAEEKIDILIFFWDPMEPQPHDVDVKALLRIAAVYNITIASTRSTADFIISSPLINEEYKPVKEDFSSYINRKI